MYFVLGAGHIRTTSEEERRSATGEQGRTDFQVGNSWKRTPEEVKVCDGLEKLAAEIGAKSITARE